MKFHPFATIPVSALMVISASYPVLAQEEPASRVSSATQVLQEFINNPEKRIPANVIQESQGIVIIPDLVRAGFILGGRRGNGIMVVRRPDGTWSNPIFITVTGGSVGAQIGAEKSDVVLVFRDRSAVDQLFQNVESSTAFGGDVKAVAGPEGANPVTPVSGSVYSYSRSEGLFAGVAFSGVNLSFDREPTATFYNQPDIAPKQVLFGQTSITPPVVTSLRQVLDQSGTVVR